MQVFACMNVCMCICLYIHSSMDACVCICTDKQIYRLIKCDFFGTLIRQYVYIQTCVRILHAFRDIGGFVVI